MIRHGSSVCKFKIIKDLSCNEVNDNKFQLRKLILVIF